MFFLLIDHLVPSITTLKCYVCNSNENSKCSAGETLEEFKIQCPSVTDPYCRKIVQTSNDEKINATKIKKKQCILFLLVNKETSVVRTCGSKIGAKSCYKTAGTNSVRIKKNISFFF